MPMSHFQHVDNSCVRTITQWREGIHFIFLFKLEIQSLIFEHVLAEDENI